MAEKAKPTDMSITKMAASSWDPSSILAMNQKALECWTRAISALTEEMGHFVQARLQEDMGTWTKLTSCKDPTQAIECQRQYAEKAATDYFDEANKLSRLTMSLANDSFSAFQAKAGTALFNPALFKELTPA